MGIQVDRDPTRLAERLAQHYKIVDFSPQPGHERSFLHCVAQGQPFVYGPTHDYSYITNHYNGVVFDIEVSRLKATAASMIGLRAPSHRLVSALSEFKTLTMDGGRSSQLIKRLARSLRFLEDPDCLLSLDIPYLQIDDLIDRHLVLTAAAAQGPACTSRLSRRSGES